MKLHFEPDLDYQRDAIEAACDLFRGQEICRTEFTVTRRPDEGPQTGLGLIENELGIGNRLTLLDDEILANLRDVQLRHGLRPSASLASGDFTVEMETGTGKTYVYLRTAFELNRRYGFTKFVVAVPSVAIKEGVHKSLQITKEHFGGLYANTPCDFFIYDSANLGQVRNFATSPNLQIMIVTVGAINKFGDEQEAAAEEGSATAAPAQKSKNVMYRPHEKTGGEKPIDLIRATRPVVIVDEPQSVDGGLDGRGKQALARMNPLCTLRYSATHADKHHMIFRLDAVDAYERRLVKQIEVASLEVEGGHNKPYVRLVSVKNMRGTIAAQVELDVRQGTGVVRKKVPVRAGDLLELVTNRAIYADCLVGDMSAAEGREYLEVRLPSEERRLRPGDTVGDVDAGAVKRIMITRTIKEHLEKELRLAPLGIKVLSLFFIDAVEHYRMYDAEGVPQKGKYALIFEEEYRKAAARPEFMSLFKHVDVQSVAEDVHDGYFSVDRKKFGEKTIEVFKDTKGTNAADEDTYALIMRDKEKLLSFDTKLKFIFSHSALREGWDNPNVFQICALREIGTERERRQTLGRGLRLCVNQQGERLRGFGVNTLTVIATESYESFADNLQKEIEEDTGIRFGIVEKHEFAAIPVTDAEGRVASLGIEQSAILWTNLREAGYLDAKGKVQDHLRTALKEGTLAVPEQFQGQLAQIKDTLRKLAGKLEIKNADERRTIPTRQAVLHSEEFQALWNRIKHKTTYRVQFDNERLIADAAEAVRSGPPVTRTRVQIRKADLEIGRGGVLSTETAVAAPIVITEGDIELPDLLTDLQDKTHLTRRSLVRILTASGRLGDFTRNPQQFIELAVEAINRTKRLALVDGIRYQRLGEDQFYAQELFEYEELTGYLKNLVASRRSIYEQVVCDSGVERSFAEQLEKNEAVKVYAKLPGWFKVPTPLGSYNADWAVLVEKEGSERLYFVVETKNSLFKDDLRSVEAGKLLCGAAHFSALAQGDNPAQFIPATNIDDLLNSI